jgi:uncharacterized membrane protein YphA (DoxX/SURF4 family)
MFIRNFSRILTGLVFIFSGFVKGVDPWGTAYKFEDYFIAMNLEWAVSFALSLSFLLIIAEFLLGWMLLFNIKTNLASWLALLFMLVFTPLTLWLAVSNKVSDCGCFGDFIVLDNWQTFFKNIVILVFVLITFAMRKKFDNKMSGFSKVIIFLIGSAVILYFIIQGLRHLPIFDFRPYKEGNKIAASVKNDVEAETVYLRYLHLGTGDTLLYTTKTLPHQDSALYNQLQFIEQVKKEKAVEEPDDFQEHNLYLTNRDGEDVTAEILGNPDFQFILVINNLDKAKKAYYSLLAELAEACDKHNIDFCATIGSTWEDIDVFSAEIGVDFDIYAADPTELKTIVRANPGLILLKHGFVLKKWHYRDIPVLEEIYLSGPFKAFASIEE